MRGFPVDSSIMKMQHRPSHKQILVLILISFVHAYYSYINIFTPKLRNGHRLLSMFSHDHQSMSLIHNKQTEEDKISTNQANITYLDQKYDEEKEVDPMIAKLFPRNAALDRRRDTSHLSDEELENLKVDDPIFLDMDWPNEAGPRAKAFARHMTWRRQLADVESSFLSLYLICSRRNFVPSYRKTMGKMGYLRTKYS